MKLRSALLVLGCGLFAGCGPYDPKSPSALVQCYQTEFGTPPPPKIKVLNARQMIIRDWGAQWLRLEVKDDALEAVILSRGFRKIKDPPKEFTSADRYTPQWWQLSPIAAFEFYENPNWTKGSWSSSRAVLAVDRARSVAFLRCDRID
jgi:hypothetical protein